MYQLCNQLNTEFAIYGKLGRPPKSGARYAPEKDALITLPRSSQGPLARTYEEESHMSPGARLVRSQISPGRPLPKLGVSFRFRGIARLLPPRISRLVSLHLLSSFWMDGSGRALGLAETPAPPGSRRATRADCGVRKQYGSACGA